MKTKRLQNKDIISMRHELHRNPELSFQESETAEFVSGYLASCGADKIQSNIGGNGVLATFESKIPGLSIMLRAELDALPILERNAHEYLSKNEGVSHACGHDGHMSILLGVAKWLSENPLKSGKVSLLFQSAEETGEGAKAILSDEKWKDIHSDYVFALHNLPGFKKHNILVKNGVFTATVKSLIIRLTGKTAHAAEPENGINPAAAMAEIIQLVNQYSNDDRSNENFSLITPVHLVLGEKAYGVAAGYGELHFTLRTWSDQQMKSVSDQLLDKVHEIAFLNNLMLEYSWTQEFKSGINDAKAVDIIRLAASIGKLKIEELSVPFSFGEDFGLFTQNFNGAMFGLGAGKKASALHNPDYDFPDEILETGILMFCEIIQLILK